MRSTSPFPGPRALLAALVAVVAGCQSSSCCGGGSTAASSGGVTTAPSGGEATTTSSGGTTTTPSATTPGADAAAPAQPVHVCGNEARAAAPGSLALLLATVQEPVERQRLGFLPADQLTPAAAKTGTPFCVYTVPLDALAKYPANPSQTAKSLLVETHMLFPVEVGGALRSAMIVERLPATLTSPTPGAQWRGTGLGGSKSIKRYVMVRQALAKGRPIESAYVVKVAGLDLAFVGFDLDGKMDLTPTARVPGVDITPNLDPTGAQKPAEPADAIFKKLQPLAARLLKIK